MDLNAEKPAQGVSCTGIWDDARSFRVGCECHDSDHDVNMWVEVTTEQDVQEVSVGFYVEGTSPIWAKGWNRFRAAWQILIHGHHRAEHHLLLKPQAAVNMADAIKTSVESLSKTKSRK